MRNLFILMMLSVVAIFTSCEGEESTVTPQDMITCYDKPELRQTVSADETSTSSDFTFTAADQWHAVVESTTKAENSDWITVDPASGNAGLLICLSI